MRHYFSVCGYGVPKDILKDAQYDLYLRIVFNKVFQACVDRNDWKPVLIFSGGKTDMRKPYQRTEAQEMIRLFRALMQREAVKKQVRGWKLVAETRALSTLENVLYSAKIVKKCLTPFHVTFFGEATRVRRISTLAKQVLGPCEVVGIDFDQSANRYLDPAFLTQKEERALKLEQWALQDPKNFAHFRKLHRTRITSLREAGPKHHVEAVRQWWEKALRELPKEASGGCV